MPPVPEQLDLLSWRPPQPVCNPIAPPLQPVCKPAAPVPCIPAEWPAIWTVLHQHQGSDQAITAPRIAQSAGLWIDTSPANAGTRVRKIIELTQDFWPWPICGDQDGYYLALNAAELSHYATNLRSRAIGIHRRAASLRRAARRAGFVYLGRGRYADPALMPSLPGLEPFCAVA